ncbi:MAG TPA: hypothetical protein PLJ89_05920 [Thermoleophilia bacterium]|nr:hypothetical protein [Thermoleophilia bacterium]
MAGRPWFRPRRHGWGLTPSSWQGWALTLGYIVAALVLGLTIAESQPWIFRTLFVSATVAFILAALLTRGTR